MQFYTQDTDGDVWSRIDKPDNPLVALADRCVQAAAVGNAKLNIEGQVGAVGT